MDRVTPPASTTPLDSIASAVDPHSELPMSVGIVQSTSLSRARWILGWATRVAEFSFVQCWVQLFTGLAGILIVRTMAKDQYALYAITNHMQTACNLLADLGIGIGVRSIGGRVWQDRRRFGELLNAALALRRWFALFSIAACLPIAAWMLLKNGGTGPTVALLCGVVAASVLPQLTATVLTIVPQLHGEYRRIQVLDFGNAVLRLSMIAALAVTQMNALLAAAVGATNNWVQMLVTRRWAHDHAECTAPPNAADRRELTRLSLRTLPNVVFFCFQGQVILLILTLVGNPSGIADVTALGRLAMLFTPVSVAFINVLVPRFTGCQDPQRLPRLYLLLVGTAVLALAPIFLAGFFIPGPLLWLLGDKYLTLKKQCGLVVATACVGQLVHLLHSLNTSKAWIRTLTTAWIPLTLAIQLAGAFTLDLRHFDGVLLFQLASASIPLPLLCLDAIHGFRRTREQQPPAENSETATQ